MPTPTEWIAIRAANALPDEPLEKFGLKPAVETLATGSGGGLTQSQVDARVALGITGKADATHSHIIGDVGGLQAALDGKQAAGSYAAASHNHTGTYQPLATVLTNTTASFTTAQETKLAGIATGATANAADSALRDRSTHTGTQSAATISDFASAADARIAAASVNALDDVTVTSPATGQVLKWNGTAWTNQADATGGGSDPWTYVLLSADFTTSSATAVNVTGLAFTPAINTTYVVEGILLFRTATATVGPRPGCSWPANLTDGVIRVDVTSAAGTQVVVNGNNSAAQLAPVGGLPTTTGSWPGLLSAVLIAGASTSGNFQVQLASETAATNVTIKAGSFIRYRSIA